jgi:hypothetical protein
VQKSMNVMRVGGRYALIRLLADAMLGPAKKTRVEVYEGGEKTFNTEIRAGAEML